jgi:hypothetical protein
MQAPHPRAGGAEGASAERPGIEALRLVPSRPRPGDRVTASADLSGAEGERVELDYEWYVDGRRLPAERGASLHVEGAEKGTRIEVVAVARGRGGVSEPARASARVANQPPVLHDVILEPLAEVSVLNDVTARPRASDADGDAIRYRYTWRVNGERVEGEGEGQVLRAERFARGDLIELEVVASDGEDESEPLRSAAIEVVNAGPRFHSKPGRIDADGVFRYRAEVEDPDGDRRFRYRLVKGPRGMRLDPLDGQVTWAPGPEQSGRHEVVLEAEDAQGAATSQTFHVQVDFETEPVPAAPAAPPAAPAEPGEFTPPTAAPAAETEGDENGEPDAAP